MKVILNKEMYAVTFTDWNTATAESVFFKRNEKRAAKTFAKRISTSWHEVIIGQLINGAYQQIERIK